MPSAAQFSCGIVPSPSFYAPPKFYGCTLTITVKEAVGLLAMDKSMFSKKGKSDPYIVLQAVMNDGAKTSVTDLGKTKHKKSTLAPLWDEEFTVELTSQHNPTLRLLVMDYDFGSSNDEMGMAEIPLLELAASRPGLNESVHTKWHPVMPSINCKKATGSISVSLSYTLTPPPTTLRRASEVESFRGGKVTLTIVKATGLLAMDSSMFSKKGSSDPYCKVMCRELSGKVTQVSKTKTVSKNLNPEWGYEKTFLLTKEHSSIVTLTVWDHDKMSGDDPMGSVTLPLVNFMGHGTSAEPVIQELAVEACEGCANATGTMTVSVAFVQNEVDPYEGTAFTGGVLVGVIKGAKDLMVMDQHVMSKASSDPFVKLTGRRIIDNKSSEKIIHKTKHKNKNLNPTFDESFAYTLTEVFDAVVTFDVADYDKMSAPDPMGKVDVNVQSLVVAGAKYSNGDNPLPYVTKDYDIMPCEGCVCPTGTLTLSLIFFPFHQAPVTDFFGGEFKITVHKAVNLPAMDSGSMFSKTATSSDPYVKVSITEHDTGKLTKKAQTKTAKKELNPEYNESYSFLMEEEHSPYVTLQVFDYDLVGNDDIMGAITLSLADPALLPSEPTLVELLPYTGCAATAGQVLISASFTRTATPRIEEFWGGVLSIKIIEGMDLIALDKGMFGSGVSDPFVKLQGFKKPSEGGMFGMGKGKKKSKPRIETFSQTKVIKKTLNPMWNERIKGKLGPEHMQNVCLALFDYDMMSGADPMGVCQINLNRYVDAEDEVQLWLDVMGCKGCKDATGKIHVSFIWAPELSPDEKKRLAEESRKKLYEKVQEPVRTFTMEEAMAEAEGSIKALNKLKFGKYLETEFGEGKLKEWREEESELEKALDKFDDINGLFTEEKMMGRMKLTYAEENEQYYDAEDFDRGEEEKDDGFGSPKNSRPGSREGGDGTLKIMFSPDKIKGDPFRKLKGNEKTELARRSSTLLALPAPVKVNMSGGNGDVRSRMASIMIKGGGSTPAPAGAMALLVGAANDKRGGGAGEGGGAAAAALGSSIFQKKKFDASKFLGAASSAGGGGEAGVVTRAKTPTIVMGRMVTTKQAQSSNDSHFKDPKQEYEKMVKGLELRLKKKGRMASNVRTVERIVPKNANHALNILNAAARDEPIKYLAEDLAAAFDRHEKETNIYASHFTKFKPLFSHPLPTSQPRFDAERMMKKLNNMPRDQRTAAAASWGLAWCIEELYMQGCSVSIANNTGYTPLHIAARFDFVDCVQVIVNIGLEPSSKVDINAETKSFLTPLRVAISSNSVNCARALASKGGVEWIKRPLEGYRSVTDVDAVIKYPWLKKMGQQPEDYVLKRPFRAVDDKAKNLGKHWENL